jgi:hypothetical protein
MRLFDRWRSFFGGSRAPAVTAAVRRLLPADNSFGVEVWDCRGYTQSTAAVSADQRVAETFVTLRASTGNEYRDRTVERAQRLDCSLVYRGVDLVAEGALFKAAQMEDKWDIYIFRPYLYFARSWSGQLQYRATVQIVAKGIGVTSIDAPSDQDPEFSQRVVDYLIKSHVFGSIAPHPLPAQLPPQPDAIAAFSFSMFGRQCHYASYSDTTRL